MVALPSSREGELTVIDRRPAHPLVSVVIPTYNRAAQVERAIDSVLAQTFSDLEAIVVDDGSTDGTAAALAARYGDDSRVRIVASKHGGVAVARNVGLDRATGSIIAFLDSDDRWQPWKLALQLECLAALPDAGMIWTDMRAVDPNGEEIPGSCLGDVLSFPCGLHDLFGDRRAIAELPSHDADSGAPDGNLYTGDIYAQMVLGNLVLPSSAVLRRSCLERVGRFDETLEVSGEDFDFFLRTARIGPVAFLDVPSVLYQTGLEDQLTHGSLSLHLTLNYLRTMEAALSRDGRAAEISADRVRRAQADGHYWAAYCYLEAGDARMARHHAWRALRLNSLHVRAVAVATLAMLPRPVRDPLLGLGRRVKGRWIGRGDPEP